ncbi:MAG TPA: ABC transporter permease [Pseudonocardiaceae bacterium]|nr:ABC transporter permease [Pseudonocardiaceae bacterium]
MSTVRSVVFEPTATRPRRAKPRRRAAWPRRARGVVGVGVAIALWALVTETGLVGANDLPTIGAVAGALADSGQELLDSLGTTLAGMFAGLGVATAAGAVLGVLVGLSGIADAATDVIVRMMRPLPSLALIPIAILVLGLGTEMTAGLVAFAAFWPVFINTRYATRGVDPRFLDAGRSLGMGRWELVRRVVLPSVAPGLGTGVRVSAGIAIVATVSVELVAGTGGLGGFVLAAQQGGATAQMYAGIVVGGVVGWLVNLVLALLLRRLLPWQAAAESRAER